MTKYILVTNGGDPSIALLQWIIECSITNVCIVYVDTGWSGRLWSDRLKKFADYATKHSAKFVHLNSAASFVELVKDRRNFPSRKYQWCASLLKGVVLNQWLDEVDPAANSTIILAKRRDSSRANFALEEYFEQSEHYQQRRVWHPLYLHTQADCQQLVTRAGFDWLGHRSLECDPCIHSNEADLLRLSDADIAKVKALEQEIGQNMFDPKQFGGAEGIQQVVKFVEDSRRQADNSPLPSQFDSGCGSPWGCGE